MIFGSQAIHLLHIKQSYSEYLVWSKSKIGVLKDIIERIQNGDEVDLKKELGTGDQKSEASWDELVREIERESRAWRSKSREATRSTAFAARSKSDQQQDKTND